MNEQIRAVVAFRGSVSRPRAAGGRPAGRQRRLRCELRGGRPQRRRLPHRECRDSHHLRAAAVRRRPSHAGAALAAPLVRVACHGSGVRRGAAVARSSAPHRRRRLRDAADRTDARLFLSADVLCQPPRLRAGTVVDRRGGGMRVGHGIEGVDGDGAVPDPGLRPHLCVRYVQRRVASAIAAVHSAGRDVAGADRPDLVRTAIPVRRLLDQRDALDLLAQSDRNDRALPAADALAARPGRRLRRAARDSRSEMPRRTQRSCWCSLR